MLSRDAMTLIMTFRNCAIILLIAREVIHTKNSIKRDRVYLSLIISAEIENKAATPRTWLVVQEPLAVLLLWLR